eukprot:9956376-Lingulodinium_polyedra.AAC.1
MALQGGDQMEVGRPAEVSEVLNHAGLTRFFRIVDKVGRVELFCALCGRTADESHIRSAKH